MRFEHESIIENVRVYKHCCIALFPAPSVVSIVKKYVNILVILHGTFLAGLFLARLSPGMSR